MPAQHRNARFQLKIALRTRKCNKQTGTDKKL